MFQSECEDDGVMTHISDTFMSGLFTPYSTFSGVSRITGFSHSHRRKAKEQRKTQAKYNLRSSKKRGRILDFETAALIEEERREKPNSKHADTLPSISQSRLSSSKKLKTLSPFLTKLKTQTKTRNQPKFNQIASKTSSKEEYHQLDDEVRSRQSSKSKREKKDYGCQPLTLGLVDYYSQNLSERAIEDSTNCFSQSILSETQTSSITQRRFGLKVNSVKGDSPQHSKAIQTLKKKSKGPKSGKIFLEDKLKKQKVEFSCYSEKDIEYLHHKSLAGEISKPLVSEYLKLFFICLCFQKILLSAFEYLNNLQGIEDDHASDAGVIQAAKNLLKDAFKESISLHLKNPGSQLSHDGGHTMFR